MSSVTTTTPPRPAAVDGRHARRDRNRDMVVAAVVGFLDDNEVHPTAQMIADRAGVSLRSVFRYFDDLDELLLTAFVEFRSPGAGFPQFDEPAPGTPLDERIERWVHFRRAACAAAAHPLVASYGRAKHNPKLHAALEQIRSESVRQLERLFATELAPMTDQARAVTVAALHSATAAETFVNMVGRHGLDAECQCDAFRRLVRGALTVTA